MGQFHFMITFILALMGRTRFMIISVVSCLVSCRVVSSRVGLFRLVSSRHVMCRVVLCVACCVLCVVCCVLCCVCVCVCVNID